MDRSANPSQGAPPLEIPGTPGPQHCYMTEKSERRILRLEHQESITEGRAPDEVYAEVRKEFGEEDLVNLSLAIITINSWNRLAIGFRKIPGEYQPHKIG